MGWKSILTAILVFGVIAILLIYWFLPLGTIEFSLSSSPENTNFTLGVNGSEEMQFYKNLRFTEPEISYSIEDCTVKKADDMEQAFNLIENMTSLDFTRVESNGEIFVTCDSKTKIEGDLFIAGEGGPTNITRLEDFNLINQGSILLLRDSKCEQPNVAIHELLHALGFDHSQNPDNIMYSVSRCDQEIGQDTLDLIDQIYSFPSLPDLDFENATASMSGRYLDISFTVRNNGLRPSSSTEVLVSADGKEVKKIDLDSIVAGHGRAIKLTNILVLQASVDEIKFLIDSEFEELDKSNNVVSFQIKK